MKKFIYLFLLLQLNFYSCKDDLLDQKPQGIIFDEQLDTPDNVEKMVTAAYSTLGNDFFQFPFNMWPYGNLRSGDAYKGGDSPGDMLEFHMMEVFSENRPDNGGGNNIWVQLYAAISKVNDALRRVNEMTEGEFPQKKNRQGELRFLRGHYYFLLKQLFKFVPFIDENLPVDEYEQISNRSLSNEALWDKIADDFRAAAENLPVDQIQVGRASKMAAKAYLAKALLFKAYKQDDNNEVVSIDATALEEVVTLTGEVITSGKYSIALDYANNFLSAYDNHAESVFAVQHSLNDGTPNGRLNWGDGLNSPMSPEYGCCGFHKPSQNLVNAYKTGTDGLPRFNDFNNTDILEGEDFLTTTFDPRLDHTVGIPGHPWKYKTDLLYQKTWARSPQVYGYYASMKEHVAPDDPAFRKWPPFMSNAKNKDIIRLAEVLLWRAEALIELGRHQEALPLINQLRERAANSTALLKWQNGQSFSNYYIQSYLPGVNCNWTQDFARQALRWETRLECAMEGKQFFNLVRWGIATEYLNTYLDKEKTRVSYLSAAVFTKHRDEYLPIPLQQVDFSKGVYQQNPGY